MKKELSNNKGITLVALIITVVVMMLIIGVSTTIGTDSLDSTRLQGFYMQLETIQKRVDDVATTNESYINSEGTTIYLKEQGIAYADLDSDKQTALQTIVTDEGEGLITNLETFRYFTIEDIEKILDLSNIEYNVFIDFDTRTIIAENGITANGETYHILKNDIYYAYHNATKNEGTIISLGYEIFTYGTGKYKIIVYPSNAVGDLNIEGTLRLKKTSSKYWETSTNLEMIINQLGKYNIEYVDKNNNTITDTITVALDEDGNPIVLSSKYWQQNKTAVTKVDINGNAIQTLEVGEEVKLKIGTEEAVSYSAGDYDGSWVVLGAERGKLLLVSKTNTQTDIRLGGAAFDANNGIDGGYLDAAAKLDGICSAYKNSTYADIARSITVEDINRITGFNPEDVEDGKPYRYGYVDQYGASVKYYMDGTVVACDAGGRLSNSSSNTYSRFVTPDNRVLGTDMTEEIVWSTYYTYTPTATGYDIAEDSLAYNTLFDNMTDLVTNAYWLASTYSHPHDSGTVCWGIRCVRKRLY